MLISGQCIKWILIVLISFSCIWLTFANGSNYQPMIFVKSEALAVGLETNTCNFNTLNQDNCKKTKQKNIEINACFHA